MRYRLSQHARGELVKRSIPAHFVVLVMQNPQQKVPETKNRTAYQSKLDFGSGKVFLLRLIVADDVDPAIVVTVYRTSKIAKYWRP